MLASRSVDLMQEVADHIRSEGSDALVVPPDLREPDAAVELAMTAIDHFGSVDVLVNNSGVGGPTAPVWEVELDDWNETLAVNVTGVFLCCQAFLPGMMERGAGTIINIGSMTGKRPLKQRSPYATSKMALIGFTRTLAAEAGPFGIRVNLISPGCSRQRADRVGVPKAGRSGRHHSGISPR